MEKPREMQYPATSEMEEVHLTPQQRSLLAASLWRNNRSQNPADPMRGDTIKMRTRRVDQMEEAVWSLNDGNLKTDAFSGTDAERERGSGQRTRTSELAELLAELDDDVYLEASASLAGGEGRQPRARGLSADGNGRRGRPKPQCWEHGCNGRQFSTFSNLLRHRREKSGATTKLSCPHCGAEFMRIMARDGHIANEKCRSSTGCSTLQDQYGPNATSPMPPGMDTLATTALSAAPAPDPSRPGQSSESASNQARQPTSKRRIGPLSCDHCRRRKIRCIVADTNKSCSNCVRLKKDCNFSVNPRPRQTRVEWTAEEFLRGWGLRESVPDPYSGSVEMEGERGRERRRRSSNASMLSERLDEIGRHHSSRAGSANPSRDPSPFQPQSPYYCSNNGFERGRSASPFHTVNMRDLDSKVSPWMSRVGDDPQSTIGRYDSYKKDHEIYQQPPDTLGYKSFAEWQRDLEPLKNRDAEGMQKEPLERADLLAAKCSSTASIRKRKLSLSPPPIARKITKSRAEERPHEAEDDGFEAKRPNASIDKQSSKMEDCEIPNSGGRKASNLVTCEVCDNFTGRPSEVRKHMKRHSRPYFCIVMGCMQDFGSKHDWIRHDVSRHHRHLHDDIRKWRCMVEGCEDSERLLSGGEYLGHSDGSRHDKGMPSDEEKGWDGNHACRRGLQLRFWCGFCDEVVHERLKPGCAEEWEQLRFDHVGDHVEKEGKRRNGWKFPASPIAWS